VERVVDYLLALEFLKLLTKPLQYAMSLLSLFNLENLGVMSSGACRQARCVFLIPKLPVGVLTPQRRRAFKFLLTPRTEEN